MSVWKGIASISTRCSNSFFSCGEKKSLQIPLGFNNKWSHNKFGVWLLLCGSVVRTLLCDVYNLGSFPGILPVPQISFLLQTYQNDPLTCAWLIGAPACHLRLMLEMGNTRPKVISSSAPLWTPLQIKGNNFSRSDKASTACTFIALKTGLSLHSTWGQRRLEKSCYRKTLCSVEFVAPSCCLS